MSHDSSSGEWIIVHENADEEHTRVQMTVVCNFYQAADREPIDGPTSCSLVVGQTLVPNHSTKSDFLDVFQSGDTLYINWGKGPDEVHQQFAVKSSKIIP